MSHFSIETILIWLVLIVIPILVFYLVNIIAKRSLDILNFSEIPLYIHAGLFYGLGYGILLEYFILLTRIRLPFDPDVTFILLLPLIIGVIFGFLGQHLIKYEIDNRRVHLFLLIHNSILSYVTFLIAIFIYIVELNQENNSIIEKQMLWSVIVALPLISLYAVLKVWKIYSSDIKVLISTEKLYPQVNEPGYYLSKLLVISKELTKIVGIQFIILLLFLAWIFNS